MYKNLIIGSDHAGYDLKKFLIENLEKESYLIKDFGCYSKESVDYPDFIHPVAKAIDEKQYEFGIIICGSGNGAIMTANKYQGVRAALCWNIEIAKLAKQHNNANIVALPARFINFETALEIVKTFLITGFEGGRHIKRVEKIKKF